MNLRELTTDEMGSHIANWLYNEFGLDDPQMPQCYAESYMYDCKQLDEMHRDELEQIMDWIQPHTHIPEHDDDITAPFSFPRHRSIDD